MVFCGENRETAHAFAHQIIPHRPVDETSGPGRQMPKPPRP